MHNILLLEDDLLLGETLEDLLDEEGYTVHWCKNGQEALDASYSNKFHLYLFDINVPLISGLTLLKELRDSDDITPTIYLTSHQEKSVMQQGFENGADDYIKKPFDTDELLLRLKALLRRCNGKSKACSGALCIDRDRYVIYENSKELTLSKKEFTLLSLFIGNSGKTVSKEMIIDALWSSDEGVSDGAIRVYINRLKQELSSVEIQNVRGIGYRLVS
ncbi:MAG: response regulator transcription factor [Thiovulaceae bacterium]|nr:response regulator transcription factor [Sulfurimonadaceae bacterium]